MEEQTTPQYKFMFIGFGRQGQKDFKAQLVSYIYDLGGSYVEKEKYHDSCTHFICIQPWPCGIQKFLGACATGKWVLTPEYILESYKINRWLAERDYEWGVTKKPTVVKIHSSLPEWVRTAPKRNRMRKLVRHKLNAGLPFKKWIVCIAHDDKIKRNACEEILKHGGAKIKNIVSFDDDQAYGGTTHVLSECISINTEYLTRIDELGLKCLHIDFIRDYILKNEKPREEDYYVDRYDQDLLRAPSYESLRALKYDFKTLKLPIERGNVKRYFVRMNKKNKKTNVSTQLLRTSVDEEAISIESNNKLHVKSRKISNQSNTLLDRRKNNQLDVSTQRNLRRKSLESINSERSAINVTPGPIRSRRSSSLIDKKDNTIKTNKAKKRKSKDDVKVNVPKKVRKKITRKSSDADDDANEPTKREILMKLYSTPKRNFIKIVEQIKVDQDTYQSTPGTLDDSPRVLVKEESEIKDEDIVPKEEDVVPKDEDSVPKTEDSVPKNEDSVPKNEDSVPKDEDIVPKDEDSVPKDEDIVPKDEDIVPKDEDIVPKDEDIVPKDEDIVPKDEDNVPKDEDVLKQDKPKPKRVYKRNEYTKPRRTRKRDEYTKPRRFNRKKTLKNQESSNKGTLDDQSEKNVLIEDKIAKNESVLIDGKIAKEESVLIDHKIAKDERVLIDHKIAKEESVLIDDKIAKEESVLIDDKIAKEESVLIDDKIAKDERVLIDDKIAKEESVLIDQKIAKEESVLIDHKIANESVLIDHKIAKDKSVLIEDKIAKDERVLIDHKIAKDASVLSTKSKRKANGGNKGKKRDKVAKDKPVPKKEDTSETGSRIKKPKNTKAKRKRVPEEVVIVKREEITKVKRKGTTKIKIVLAGKSTKTNRGTKDKSDQSTKAQQESNKSVPKARSVRKDHQSNKVKKTTKTKRVPEVESTKVESVPEVESNKEESVQQVESTKEESVSKEESTKKESVPEVESTKKESVPEVESTKKESVPEVESTKKENVPEVESTKKESVPEVESTKSSNEEENDDEFDPYDVNFEDFEVLDDIDDYSENDQEPEPKPEKEKYDELEPLFEKHDEIKADDDDQKRLRSKPVDEIQEEIEPEVSIEEKATESYEEIESEDEFYEDIEDENFDRNLQDEESQRLRDAKVVETVEEDTDSSTPSTKRSRESDEDTGDDQDHREKRVKSHEKSSSSIQDVSFFSSEEAPTSPDDTTDPERETTDQVAESLRKTFPQIFLWDTEYHKNDKSNYSIPRGHPETEMPNAITELFNSCVDQYKLEHAMNFFISVSAHGWYPHPKVLNKIIQFLILNPDDSNSTDKAGVLFNTISRDQPALTPSLSDAYVKALCPFPDGSAKSAWSTLAEIISSCVLNQINCHILFQFYTDVFEQDFEAFLRRTTDPSTDFKMRRVTCPVLTQIFWSSSVVGTITKPLEELFAFVYQSIVQTDCDVSFNYLITLLGLVAECTRLSESNCVTVAIMGLKSKELIRTIFDKCRLLQLDNVKLYKFLCALKPSWLQAHLISELLTKLPRVELSPTRIAEPLSLAKILECYVNPIGRGGNHQPRSLKTKPDGESPLKATVINRRNRRGETRVHAACVENQPDKLKRLLDVPGVDVNIRDYAGWTPLHEACNGGYVQCVSLLLKHDPGTKNVTRRLKKDPVDLMAKSNDGTTPMHDAVANDHVEVVKCLLDKGGLVLLNIKSNNEATPLDQIKSSRMKELIKTFTEKHFDQENSPIDSPCNLTTEPEVEKSYEISWYLSLLRLLIRSYLKTTKLQQIERGLKRVLHCAQKEDTYENMLRLLEECLKLIKGGKVPDKELVYYSNDLKYYQGFKNKVEKCKSDIIASASEDNKKDAENELNLLLMFL